jgi:hypothetical protein
MGGERQEPTERQHEARGRWQIGPVGYAVGGVHHPIAAMHAAGMTHTGAETEATLPSCRPILARQAVLDDAP